MRRMGNSGVSLLLLLLSTASFRLAHGSVIGCGGFVQASKELATLRTAADERLDYSGIKVELQNSEGRVTETTQCAPNGYYFLPVYQPGSYIVTVKGPPGWSFRPPKAPVTVDSKACNDDQDINFFYTGFDIAGRVIGASVPGGSSSGVCAASGPANVTVAITALSRDGVAASEPLASVQTCHTGGFKLSNLLVGKYKLTASHPKWKVIPLKSTELSLGWSNLYVDDMFQVAGYDLSGSVEAQGNPMPGVKIFLFSPSLQFLTSCTKPSASSLSPLPGKTPLCEALSGADGSFEFTDLPCGEYLLAPSYQGSASDSDSAAPSTAVFDVSPKEMAVEVGHASVRLGTAFQVRGFAVSGRVVDGAGQGIAGASVSVNGEVKAVTDSEGVYNLGSMTSGTFTIAATGANYKFAPLEGISVVPSAARLPDISPSHYSVCGMIRLDEGSSFSPRRRLALTHIHESVPPQTAMADDTGAFCLLATPGSYHLSFHVSPQEASTGLLLHPKVHSVVVLGQPITGILFTQSYLSISGVVRCKQKCPPSVRITLEGAAATVGSTSSSPPSSTSSASASSLSEPRVVHLSKKNGSYSFDRLLPGHYRLTVFKEPPAVAQLPGDEWCWVANSINVSLSDSPAADVTFEQTGFKFYLQSQVADIMSLVSEEETRTLEIKPGTQEFCLASPGMYTLIATEGCFYYGFFYSFYETSSPVFYDLVPEAFKVYGEVKVDSRVFPLANHLVDHSHARLYFLNGTVANPHTFLKPKQAANESHPVAVYEYDYYLSFGDRHYVAAYHTGKVLEEEPPTVDELADVLKSQGDSDHDFLIGRGFTESEIDSLDQLYTDNGGPSMDGPYLQNLQKILDSKDASLAARLNYQKGVEGGGINSGLTPEADKELVQLLAEEQAEEARVLSEVLEKGVEEVSRESEGKEAREEEPAEGEEEEEEDYVYELDEQEVFYPPYRERYHLDSLEMEERYPEETGPLWVKRKRLLFYPRTVEVYGEKYNCPKDMLPTIVGRPGIYFLGRIIPALPRVNVTVVADSDSANAGWKKGEVVSWVTTVDFVKFNQKLLGDFIDFEAGPLYDDATYHLEPVKLGYTFTHVGNNTFKAEKLASITVRVTQPSSANEKLPPVLLSLTGDGAFRRNEPTNSSAAFTFMGLFPGSYYLRALLKEYEFEPPAASIELGSGEEKVVTLAAKRVAFSVMGTVRQLAGAVQGGVDVEAVEARDGSSEEAAHGHEGAHFETATTGEDGRFRLRGLKPGAVYSVQVSFKQPSDSSLLPRFERAMPSQRLLTITGDTTGADFVVFPSPAGIRLTGSVNGADVARWQPHISVELLAPQTSVLVQSIPLPLSRFFEFKDVPRGKYVVRLRLGLPERTHTFEALPAEVDLLTQSGQQGAVAVHAGEMTFKAAERAAQPELASSPLLPMLLCIGVIAVIASLSRLRDIFTSLTSSSQSSEATSSWFGSRADAAAKEAKKPSSRRRTY